MSSKSTASTLGSRGSPEQFDDGKDNDDDHHKAIGGLQRPYEIVDRRQRDHLPGLTKTIREISEGLDRFRSVYRRSENKAVRTE